MHTDDTSAGTLSHQAIAAAPKGVLLSRLARERESRRRDQLLAALAHELRNRLGPLDTALELLELGRDDPLTVDRALPVARRQVKQLCRLADELVKGDAGAAFAVGATLRPDAPPVSPAAIRVTRP